MASTCHLPHTGSLSRLPVKGVHCQDTSSHTTGCRNLSSGASYGEGLATWLGRPKLGKAERRSLQIRNVGWDPEGILAPPQGHHITRRKVMKEWAKDAEAKEKAMAEARKELERRAEIRNARVVPESNSALVEYLLDTESQEMEFEIARCRKRLDDAFFQELKSEIGSLRFAVNQTEQTQDRIAELEALEKALKQGVEAYDKLTSDMISAKDRLTRLLTAKDKKATLLEMAGENALDRPLLALLDENTARAREAGQDQAAEFMEKVRSAVLKYLTV